MTDLEVKTLIGMYEEVCKDDRAHCVAGKFSPMVRVRKNLMEQVISKLIPEAKFVEVSVTVAPTTNSFVVLAVNDEDAKQIAIDEYTKNLAKAGVNNGIQARILTA